MNLNSYYEKLGQVDLPYKGRQLYMHTTSPDAPSMPEGFEDYEPIVRVLSEGRARKVHVTVDEKELMPGETQRRPRAHVDGWFYPDTMRWGGPAPGWRSHANKRMAIITASSVPGCAIYPGVFSGVPSDGGDLEHIRDQFGCAVIAEPFCGYYLSPDCVHESLPMLSAGQRTFLRIALEP